MLCHMPLVEFSIGYSQKHANIVPSGIREQGEKMSEEELRKAQIDQEAVEFSERLAIENPGMYSVEEMRELIERHAEATAATDAAMREDLASMPPEAQAKMKEMLRARLPEDLLKEIFGEDF